MWQEILKLWNQNHLLLEKNSSAPVFQSLIADTRELESLPKNARAVFFARKGSTFDGHLFLEKIQSDERISAFVVEKIPSGFKPQAPVWLVRDSVLALALAVKVFYQDPSSQLFAVAVTGTNGKTTTTFLLESLLKEMGKSPARIGTIEIRFKDLRIESSLTTPDFLFLQKALADLKTRGADSIAFEASSHALDQKRLLGIDIDAAIFTNLTAEHLDYHGNMENYFHAKRRLFVELLSSSSKTQKIAVVPEDGIYGSRLIEELNHRQDIQLMTWTFLKDKKANLIVKDWKTDLSGSRFSIDGWASFQTSLVGQHNIENIMGVLALGKALGLTAEKCQSALNNMSCVPGRLERVDRNGMGAVFVDYAHTSDALENVLSTLRSLTKGKLKVVFGCGGDRDRLKRPKMGSVAELYADEVWVTSDNPRTEDPESIIREILTGIQGIKPSHIQVDRATAIQESLKSLAQNDVLLIAGKGHETYQIIGTQKFPFDDREVVRKAI